MPPSKSCFIDVYLHHISSEWVLMSHINTLTTLTGAYPGGALGASAPRVTKWGQKKKEKERKGKEKKKKINHMMNRAPFKHKQERPGGAPGKKTLGAPN